MEIPELSLNFLQLQQKTHPLHLTSQNNVPSKYVRAQWMYEVPIHK